MNYSFRKKNKTVKYLIIHYTGMIDFYSAYRKLNDLKSEVSCHYLISREGKIYNLLCPKFKGWHAGISEWKNVKNLNDYSIGIELENNYNFSKDLDLKISYQLLFAYDKKNYQSVKDNKIFARDPITLESIVISKNKFIGLPNRSRHNINANIGYMDKYFLRLLVRSKYGVYDTNGNGFIDHYDSSIINNYLNINFSYNADLTKNLILNLTIKNLNNFKNESLLPNVFGREFIGRLTYSIN